MRNHFFVIIVAMLVTATVCAAGCASSVTPSAVPSPTRSPTFVPKNISGYLNYTNRSAGITIQYPRSSQLNQGGGAGATAFFTVSGVNMSFSIAAGRARPGVTLDGYSQDLISALQQTPYLTNFTLLNSSNTTLAGYPAQKLVYTYVTQGAPTQGMIELTLVNNTGYSVSYVASQSVYPSYVGIAQNMMQSFNITS